MTQRMYCEQDHPGSDAEADQWCEWYHRPTVPRTTSKAHEFLSSGCRYQWAADHDDADCARAFQAECGARVEDER